MSLDVLLVSLLWPGLTGPGIGIAGHRRKQHNSAVAAATARRDELQQLLDQDKEDFIDNQAMLAQQPDVSYSSKPAAHEVSTHQAALLHEGGSNTAVAALMMALPTQPLTWLHVARNLMHSVRYQQVLLLTLGSDGCRLQPGRQQGYVCVPHPWQQRTMLSRIMWLS